MFEDFLSDRCDIFHLEDQSIEIGYGIEATGISQPAEEPAAKDIPCHFHNKTNTLRIIQHEPYSSLEGEVKLSLPFDTDIRENDLVVNKATGIRYRADVPKYIRKHHITVMLKRESGVQSAV